MATKYTQSVLEEAAKASLSYAGMLRHLGLRQAGGTQAHIARKTREYGIDTSHFTGAAHNKGKTSVNRKSVEDILVVLPTGSRRPKRNQLLRAMLAKGLTYQCEGCYNSGTWLGKTITLDIDHRDGDWLNNRIENLRSLCPNCHSQCDSTNKPHKYR